LTTLSPEQLAFQQALNERTADTGIAWEASANVGGKIYSARSRHGAPNALARELVVAGVADDRVEVRYAGLRGCLSYRSLHAMAGFTYSEGAASPLHRVRCHEFFVGAAAGDEAGIGEETTDVAVWAAPGPSVTTTCADCGKPFKPRRSTATFCSGRCRVAAHRRAKAA
jgi:hypothetical protein